MAIPAGVIIKIKGNDYYFEPFRNEFGESRWRTKIICPICGQERLVNKRTITESVNFTGRCKKCNWELCGFGKGKNHSAWKGGKRLNKKGYIIVRVNGKDVLEHRYIVEKNIGRPLEDYEHVHHLNGIKYDNRIENLVLIDGSVHQIVTALEEKIKRLETEIRLLKGEVL